MHVQYGTPFEIYERIVGSVVESNDGINGLEAVMRANGNYLVKGTL